MVQMLSDFLRGIHRELCEGLLAPDTQDPLISLKVDTVETEIPLDIRLGETKTAAYRSIDVKPPVPSLGLKNEFRYSRIRIHWIVKYHDR